MHTANFRGMKSTPTKYSKIHPNYYSIYKKTSSSSIKLYMQMHKLHAPPCGYYNNLIIFYYKIQLYNYYVSSVIKIVLMIPEKK